MARDRTYDEVALSALNFFETKPRLWVYGDNKAKWPELEAVLDSVKDFHVVNALTQWHQTNVAKLVDSGVDSRGGGILHGLAYSQVEDSSKAVLLLQGLLQVGASPNLATAFSQWTPSHFCALRGSVDIARALVLCRPNLTLEDSRGFTPAGRARSSGYVDVANVFEEAGRKGFPTIAQLAHEEKWWAVQNLCKRGVVPNQEKLALHGGKDAIGWAVHHKQLGVAKELAYLLKGVVRPEYEGVEAKLVALKADLPKRSDAEKEAMKRKVEKQEECLKQLKVDQALLKKEGGELKEMVLLSLTKTGENNEALKKELMTAVKRMHSKLIDDLQGKWDHQAKKMKIDCSNKPSLPSQEVAGTGEARQDQAVPPIPAHQSFQVLNEVEKFTRLEADNRALEAENKALKDKVDQLQGTLEALRALLGSFGKADK